ncbi:MAG: transglycosylase family protein [Solirubrobacteraceae bacterium]
MPRLRPTIPAPALSFALLAAVTVAWALAAGSAGGADRAESLRNGIESKRDRERALSGSIARLARLERVTAREIAIFERRVAAVQRELAAAQAILDRTITRRDRAQARALRLRARLTQAREQLAKLLRERYAGGRPDALTVVLEADGFANLLETVDFLHRIQRSDQEILRTVRDGRHDAVGQRRVLTRLSVRRRSAADAVRRRHDALTSIADGLRGRRASLARARAARSALLRGSRRSRRSAERALTRLLAQRDRAIGQPGPGGPWAIPWVIVQCESGGQNLPPNHATASGYYQFIDSTWRGLGGSTPHAHQASKSEQDRLAARLWNGGRGAGNWDCAALVGVI